MLKDLIVTELFIYPIKSLGGIRVPSAKVLERGFQYDRRWMLVDDQGYFLTQRTFSKLALLQVELDGDCLKVFHKGETENSIRIPLDSDSDESYSVMIWDDEVKAKGVGYQYDQWFSEQLGVSVRLVQMQENGIRLVDPKYAKNSENVSFADGMPYLIIGESSLEDLNNRLDDSVGMDRFRPNIVFAGGQPFEEDRWSNLEIGDALLKGVKPCARCVMTTVNQDTGQGGKEPLRTLSKYRLQGNKVLFGQNALAVKNGEIRVGDPIIKL